MDDLFKSDGFQVSDPVPITELASDNENFIHEADEEYFEISNGWMSEVLANLRLPNKIAFLAYDLMRYHWNDYVDVALRRDKIQLFIVSCIYLSVEVCSLTMSNILLELSDMTCNAYSSNEILNYVSFMFMRMGGMIGRKTLYDYLPSLNMLIEAVELMKSPHYLDMNRKQ